MDKEEELRSLLVKAAEYSAKANAASGDPKLKAALDAVAREFLRQASALRAGLPREADNG